MGMTIQITIKKGTGGDNERIVKKLKRALRRANIGASTKRNRNRSATLITNPGRMQTEAQAIVMINELIKTEKLSKGQFELVIENDEEE